VTGTVSPDDLAHGGSLITIDDLGFMFMLDENSGGGFTFVYLQTKSEGDQFMDSGAPDRMYTVGQNLLSGTPADSIFMGSWENNVGKPEKTIGEIGDTLYMGFRAGTFLADEQRYAYNYGFAQLLKTGDRSYRVEGYAYESEFDTDLTVFNIPAPGTAALLGLAGLAATRRRR
jgi:hypothetical protein